MRDLIKIYKHELKNTDVLEYESYDVVALCGDKLKKQIKRNDITILNITRIKNVMENCLDCYVDYEFWGGK